MRLARYVAYLLGSVDFFDADVLQTYCANNYAQPFTSTTPTYSVYGPSVGVTPSFDCACATGHAAYTTTTSSAGTAGQQTTCANAADYAMHA
jgi:hypothetical protein